MNCALCILAAAFLTNMHASPQDNSRLMGILHSLDNPSILQSFLCDICESCPEQFDFAVAHELITGTSASRSRLNLAATIARCQLVRGADASIVRAAILRSYQMLVVSDMSTPEDLVDAFALAGLFDDARQTAELHGLIVPLECLIVSEQYAIASAKLQSQPLLIDPVVLSPGWHVARSGRLENAAHFFRQFGERRSHRLLGEISMLFAERADFASAMSARRMCGDGSVGTAVERVLSEMNPVLSDSSWYGRDTRTDLWMMAAATGDNDDSLRKGFAWSAVQCARLESERGFREVAAEICEETTARVSPGKGLIKPRDMGSFADEVDRIRIEIAAELVHCTSYQGATEILAELISRSGSDVGLQALQRAGRLIDERDEVHFAKHAAERLELSQTTVEAAIATGRYVELTAHGRWTSPGTRTALMLLADDVRIRIEAGVFLTTDVEIAAMTQGQEALSAMMSHWVNTQSTSELFVMLWHSPETFCPPDLLLACLKIESAPVKLLASTKLLQNSTEHQLEAIRELCRLANTADMNLRYAALAALAQKRVEGRLELNNDEVRRIEGDDPEIDALMGVLHGQVDVDLVSCALQTENSWLHGLVARAAARQCANDQTHDALRHVLNTDRQFAILSAFDQLFKMGRRPEQEISDIDRIFQDPDSSELLRRTRQLQREAARN